MARHERVEKTIQKEVSSIIHDELKDPRLGFVTITRVELTRDLRDAKIYFSVLGKEQDYKRTKDALDSALGFIRSLIARRIRLRFAPTICFKEDKSAEYSIRIQEVLNQIEELNAPLVSSKKESGKKIRKESCARAKKTNRLSKRK